MKRCARCGGPRDREGQRYCRSCHAAYMREARAKGKYQEPYDRRKNVARVLANRALKQGRIKRQPCKRCGKPGEEMHHPDYDKPREVEWYCRRCHKAIHA